MTSRLANAPDSNGHAVHLEEHWREYQKEVVATLEQSFPPVTHAAIKACLLWNFDAGYFIAALKATSFLMRRPVTPLPCYREWQAVATPEQPAYVVPGAEWTTDHVLDLLLYVCIYMSCPTLRSVGCDAVWLVFHILHSNKSKLLWYELQGSEYCLADTARRCNFEMDALLHIVYSRTALNKDCLQHSDINTLCRTPEFVQLCMEWAGNLNFKDEKNCSNFSISRILLQHASGCSYPITSFFVQHFPMNTRHLLEFYCFRMDKDYGFPTEELQRQFEDLFKQLQRSGLGSESVCTFNFQLLGYCVS